MSLANVRVVLVRTHYAGNLGAAARVLHNFGLRELVLVEPIADPAAHDARRLATHGVALLEAARVFDTLQEAVADCVEVAATSALKAGYYREDKSGPPEAVLPRLLEAASSGPVALVFGPEPHGLTNAEVSLCHYLIHIPTDPEYPALNLAQAVAVCCYEAGRAVRGRLPADAPGPRVAGHAELERMYAHLQEGLEAIHFLYGPKTPTLMQGIRQMLNKARLTDSEARILHGMARQMLWVARQAGRLPPGAPAETGGEP